MNKITVLLLISFIALTGCKKDSNGSNVTPSNTNQNTPPPPPPPLPVNLPTVSLVLAKTGPISSDYVTVRGTVSITENDTLLIDSIKISYVSVNNGTAPFNTAGTPIKKESFIPTKNYTFDTLLFVRDSSRFKFTIWLRFKNGATKSYDTDFVAK